MSELNRREFVATAGCVCAGLLTGAWPAMADSDENIIDIGPLSDFKSDGITEKWERNGFFVVRMKGYLIAPSARCTHQESGRLIARQNGTVFCPMHGSTWDRDGIIDNGPAKRSLPRHQIWVNEKKRVIVHLTRTYDEKRWTDPKAFIKL